MPADNETDLELLEDLKQGRDTALDELMQRWERPLVSFAYRYVQSEEDARDLVEELFVRVYRYKDRFKPDTKFSAWAFTSLSNLCKNFERWKRRHPAFSRESLTDDVTSAETSVHPLAFSASWQWQPDREAQKQEIVDLVKDSIHKLPHDLKITMLLYQYEGLSYKEIGRVVGCTVKGVETRLYRARKSLKKIMTSRYVEMGGQVPVPATA